MMLGTTVLIGCSTNCVHNQFYETIFPNINERGRFLFQNSTFTAGTTKYSGQAFEDTNKTDLVLTEAILEIVSCNFTNCIGVFSSAEEPSGGAFVYTPVGTTSLTVKSSTFDKCRSNANGGGFSYYSDSGTARIESSHFLECSCQSDGGGLRFSRTIKGEVVLCNFTECSCLGYGAAVTFLIFGTPPAIVTQSRFISCFGGAEGAIHQNFQGTPQSVTISHNFFHRCSKHENGTLTYCTCVRVVHNSPLTVMDNTFEECDLNENNAVMLITSVTLSSYTVSGNTYTDMIPSSTSSNDVHFPILVSQSQVLKNGVVFDEFGCRSSSDLAFSNKLEGIPYVLNTVSSKSMTFTIHSGFVDETLLLVSGHSDLRISEAITFDFSSSVNVRFGDLSGQSVLNINSCPIIAPTAVLTTHLFSVADSTLLITGLAFTNFKFASAHLFDITGESTFTLTSTTFSGVTAEVPHDAHDEMAEPEITRILRVQGPSTVDLKQVTVQDSLWTRFAWIGGHADQLVRADDCVFQRLTLTSAGGCFVFMEEQGTLELTNSRFEELTSHRSGVVVFSNKTKNVLKVTSCQFTDLNSAQMCSAIRMLKFSITTVKKCSFTNCQSRGAIGVMAVWHTSSTNEISDCVFDSCASTASYGASLELDSTSVILKNVVFIDCQSNERSVVIIRSAHKNQVLQNITFIGCSTETEEADVDLWSAKDQALLSTTDVYSTSHMPHYSRQFEDGDVVPFPKWKVGVDGEDTRLCAIVDRICQTVPFVVSQCTAENTKRTKTEMQTMTLLDASLSIDALNIGNKSITIRGEKDENQLRTSFSPLPSVSSAFFIVQNGRLGFSDLKLIPFASGSFVSADSSDVSLSGCVVDGSVLGSTQLTFPFISTTGNSLSISDSTFTAFRLSGTTLISTAPSSLSISDSTFSSIKSEGTDGSALHVTLASNAEASSLSVNAEFTDCSCGEGQKGQALFVNGYSFASLLSPSNWVQTTSFLSVPDDDALLWGNDLAETSSSLFSSITLLYYLIPYNLTKVFAGSVGRDEAGCGRQHLPCPVLSTALSHLQTDTAVTLVFVEDWTLADAITFCTTSTTLTSSPTNLAVECRANSHLSVTSASLTLAALTFTALNNPRSTSFLSVSGDGSLIIQSCLFSDFTSSKSGSVLSATLSESASLSVEHSTFSSCHSDEHGGVAHLKMDGGSFTFDADSSFDSCTSQKKGAILFVEASDLSLVVTKESLAFLPHPLGTIKPQDLSLYTGINTGKPDDVVPLILYFADIGSTGFASGDGKDVALCGFDIYPCSSLTAVQSMLEENGTKLEGQLKPLTIELTGTVSLTQLFTCGAHDLTIVKNCLSLTGAGQLKSSLLSSLTLSSLHMVFGSMTSTTALLVSDGTVTVDACSFGDVPANIPITLGTVLSGSLVWKGTNSLNVESLQTPLFVISGGFFTLQPDSVSFGFTTPLVSAKSLLSHTGGLIQLNTIDFENITKSTGDGSVISAALSSGSQTIQQSEFVSCSTSSGNGGALSVSLSAAASLTIKSTSFRRCSSSLNGGALHVDITALTTGTLNLSGVSFGSGEEVNVVGDGGEGVNVFVVGRDFESSLAKIILPAVTDSTESSLFWGKDMNNPFSSSLLVYLLPIKNSAIVGSAKAKDIDHCGHFGVGCVSIDKAFSRISSSSESSHTINVHSDASLSGGISPTALTTLTVQSTIDRKLITVSSQAKFTAVDGSLILRSLSFACPEQSFAHSLIMLSSSTQSITLSSCAFSDFTLASHPLVEHSDGRLDISSSTFSAITRQFGNGAVMSSIMKDSMTLAIDTVTLTNPSSTSGACDGIFVSFDSFENGPEQTAFNLTKLTFIHTSQSNTIAIPQFLSITGKNLSHWIKTGDPRFTWTNTDVADEMVWAEDIHSDIALESSLLFYLKAGEGAIGVDSHGYRISKCGYFSVWCDSIEYGLSRQTMQGTTEMNVIDSIGVEKKLELTSTLHLNGYQTTSALIFDTSGQFALSRPVFFSFSHICLTITPSHTAATLFALQTGNLELTQCSLKSSEAIKTSLVHQTGGDLDVAKLSLTRMTFTATLFSIEAFDTAQFRTVNVQGCSMAEFLRVESNSSESDVDLIDCMFDGHRAESEEGGEVCTWTAGLLNFSNCNTTITTSTFSNLAQGAIFTNGGMLALHGCAFETNSASNTTFPSANRNVFCTGNGNVSISSLSSGDGESTPSHWISSDTCHVTKAGQNMTAPLFVPTLSSSSSTTLNKKDGKYTIQVVGTTLIPCGLFLDVFEKNKDTVGNSHPINLALSSTSFTETSIQLVVPSSELSSKLSSHPAWHARLLFGDNVVTETSFLVKVSAADERKALMTQAMKWWLPIVIAVSVLLALFIVIVCLLVRRRRKKQEEGKTKLLANAELNTIDELKTDIVLDENPVMDDWTSARMVEGDKRNPFPAPTEENINDAKQPTAEYVFGMHIAGVAPGVQSDAFEGVLSVDRRDTLYARLHGSQNPAEINRADVQRLPFADVLKHFSPHWVLFDQLGEVFIRTRETEEDRTDTTRQTKAKLGSDNLRWSAPEVAEDGTDARTSVDPHKTAVFSLGLVLWEIETGLVPFGEMDAINAQRQAGLGIFPNMQKVKDEALAELILTCLNPVASERPTLADVEKKLDGILSEPALAPAHQPIQAQDTNGG
ncbi:hypothetical protein BLNAU_10583 [Blattamonas nauphoetae]|uniref:Serine-threonine/tyrosine-protein kinase catalytic domain-containing protein n=1 Tax=Blattamonas nauphoetae TaxID=2049346 RepID=A0ABQ9XT25_9EUKA|nr:hypothetical protein BLNAU_10583 [Blattamonas nauphoetae]